ncbi:hypothetical protein [Cohnella sp.]
MKLIIAAVMHILKEGFTVSWTVKPSNLVTLLIDEAKVYEQSLHY